MCWGKTKYDFLSQRDFWLTHPITFYLLVLNILINFSHLWHFQFLIFDIFYRILTLVLGYWALLPASCLLYCMCSLENFQPSHLYTGQLPLPSSSQSMLLFYLNFSSGDLPPYSAVFLFQVRLLYYPSFFFLIVPA